jgi:hypothetical protein
MRGNQTWELAAKKKKVSRKDAKAQRKKGLSSLALRLCAFA